MFRQITPLPHPHTHAYFAEPNTWDLCSVSETQCPPHGPSLQQSEVSVAALPGKAPLFPRIRLKGHKASLLLQFSLSSIFLQEDRLAGLWTQALLQSPQLCSTPLAVHHKHPYSSDAKPVLAAQQWCARIQSYPSNFWQANTKHNTHTVLKVEQPFCFQNCSCYSQRCFWHLFATVRATISNIRMSHFKTVNIKM